MNDSYADVAIKIRTAVLENVDELELVHNL